MSLTSSNVPHSSLLLVYTDFGTQLSEHSFHGQCPSLENIMLLTWTTLEWYDTEHVPQRINFPGCSNASRYRAIDSKQPSWAALYHLSSPDISESKEWYRLNELASDTERTILSTLPIVTRSIYTQRARELSTSHFTSATPAGKVICIVHLHVSRSSDSPGSPGNAEIEAQLGVWYESFINARLSKTPGWLRSRIYTRCSGSDMKTTPELKIAMDCSTLVVHEWDADGDAMEISGLESNVTAQASDWEKEHKCTIARETRIFSLHREW